MNRSNKLMCAGRKFFLTILFFIILTATNMNVFAESGSGTCGDCVWTIDDDGVLVIAPENGTEGTLEGGHNSTLPWPWSGSEYNISAVKIEGTVHAGEDASWMFLNMENAKTFDLAGLDTTGTKFMKGMFANCTSVQQLDTSMLDTSSVVSMYQMFSACTSLTNLDLTNMHTENVTDMKYMFMNCNLLSKLVLGNNFSFRGGNITAESRMAALPGTNWIWNGNSHTADEIVSMDKDIQGVRTYERNDPVAALYNGDTLVFQLDPYQDPAYGELTNVWSLDVTKSYYYDQSTMARPTTPWDRFNRDIRTVICRDKISPVSIGAWFYNFTSLTSVDLEKLDASHLTDLSYTFYNCSKLEELDISKWNASNLKSLKCAFYGCRMLKSLDVSKWDTSGVSDFKGTFAYCENLETLDISDWNTGNAHDFWRTFYLCSSLLTLDVSRWDMRNVVSLDGTFCKCESLCELNVSGWNTSAVKNMEYTFSGCTSLSTLDVSNWDVSNVTSMNAIFYTCKALYVIDVSKWNTPNVNDYSYAFDRCGVKELDLSNWAINVANESNLYRFLTCSNLRKIKLGPSFTFKNSTYADLPAGNWKNTDTGVTRSEQNIMNNYNSSMAGTYVKDTPEEDAQVILYTDGELEFLKESSPQKKPIEEIYAVNLNGSSDSSDLPWLGKADSIKKITIRDLISPTSTEKWFYELKYVTEMDIEKLDMSNVVSTSRMFQGCEQLTSIDLSGWDVQKVQNISSMFENCISLTDVNLSGWNASVLTLMNYLFSGCTNLVNVNTSGWNTPSLTKAAGVFYQCAALTDLNLSDWDTERVQSFSLMFSGCSALQTLNISGWNTNQSFYLNMFKDCISLQSVTIGEYFSFCGRASAYSYKALLPGNEWKNTDTGSVYKSDELINVYDAEPGTYIRTDNMICAILYDNGTLVLQRSNEPDTNEGEVIHIWPSVWIDQLPGANSINFMPWYDYRRQIKQVVFRDKIAPGSMHSWFYECEILDAVNAANLDLSRCTTLSKTFYGCKHLQCLNLSGKDASRVTDLSYMFYGCQHLNTVEISDWNTESAVDLRNTFAGCSELEELDLQEWNTKNMTYGRDMFIDCHRLKKIRLGENFSFTGSTGAQYMRPSLPDGTWTREGTEEQYTAYTLGSWTNEDGARMAGTYLKTTAVPGDPICYAVLYENGTMVFQNEESADPEYGEKTEAWAIYPESRYSTTTDTPWYNRRDNIRSVIVRDPVSPVSTRNWFKDMPNLVYADLTHLDTVSATTDMAYMFTDSAITGLVLGDNFSFMGHNKIQYEMGLPSSYWVHDGSGQRYTTQEMIQEHENGLSGYFYENPSYAILYADGELVFQFGNQTDEDREVIEMWPGSGIRNGLYLGFEITQKDYFTNRNKIPWNQYIGNVKKLPQKTR